MSVAKTILKRLFRVYAHIYHQHFDSVIQLQEEAHLNTSFKHFIFFVQVCTCHWGVRVSVCRGGLAYHKQMNMMFSLANLNENISLSLSTTFVFQEFNLIDRKELAPLQELIEKLTSKDR